MKTNRLLLIIVVLVSCIEYGHSQDLSFTDTLSVKVYFRRGYSVLEPQFRDNKARLETFTRRVEVLRRDTMCRVGQICVAAFASPEGSLLMNERLSEKRAARIADFLRRTTGVSDSLMNVKAQGIDWEGLTELVTASDMPYRDEVLNILHDTPEQVVRNGVTVDGRKRRLIMLHNRRAWDYMNEHFFPELRSSGIHVFCRIEHLSDSQPAPEPEPSAPVEEVATVPEQVTSSDLLPEPPASDAIVSTCKPFYMALKTNLLYDAALIPNLGAEFYLGNGWSIGGNWMYAWWKSDKHHNYWRIYGGEIDLRKYFGRRAKEKPLTGHHLGLYGQMLTYDFETGGTGYLSDFSYGAGIEYGYSLPVGRRLNLDFGIGIGYLGGEYKEYIPIDTHYVWQQTRQRHWFGPTKAEVSLVWLIGCGNFNEKKGGKR